MDLSITLIEGGWCVMVDNTTNRANLCIPHRNGITLSFITVQQFETYDEAKEQAIGFSVLGYTAADYLREGEQDAQTEDAAQVEAAATTTPG